MPFRRRKRRPGHPWWQKLIRAGVVVAVVLLGSYVTLPWWVPTSLVRHYLAKRMSEQMGVEVSIRELSLSWGEGVQIRDFTVNSPDGFGEHPMLVVDRLSAEFSPIDFFVRGRMAWMEIQRPRLSVEVAESGEVNVSVLENLLLDVTPDRISVRQGTVVLSGTADLPPVELSVSDLQFVSGNPGWLGRVSMSAELRQTGASAPVSLRLTGARDKSHVASAAFNFSDVDLQQLHLHRLLDLPLEKLSGTCSGSLELQINPQAVVDRFGLNLSVRQLDAQPRHGPSLPVVDEAFFRISAAYDMLSGQLEVSSASVRLPGIDVAGTFKLLGDVRERGWEAVESLDLEGQAHPGPLSSLLTGSGELPGGWSVDGPVSVSVRGIRDNEVLSLWISADGTGASLARNGEIIKPEGQSCELALRGAYDRRSGILSAEKVAAALGANHLTLQGKVGDVRPALRCAAEDLPAALDQLAHVEWEGSWEIRDPAPVGRFLPAPWSALGDVKLDGAITGKLFIDSRAGMRVQVFARAPADTGLVVGRHFVQPDQTPVRLDLMGQVEFSGPTVKNLTADLILGAGRVTIERGYFRTSPSATDGESGRHYAGWRLEGDRIEEIARAFPAVGRWFSGLSGAFAGRVDLEFGSALSMARASVDLSRTAFALGEGLVKPAGQEATLEVEFAGDPDLGEEGKAVTATAKLPGCSVKVRGSLRPADGETFPPEGNALVEFEITDARRLAESFPAPARALGKGRFIGTARGDINARWAGSTVQFETNWHADEIEWVMDGQPGRGKQAGVPLRLTGYGELTGLREGAITAELVADVELAGSRAWVRLSPAITVAPGGGSSPPEVSFKGLEGQVSAEMEVDQVLRQLLPELDDLCRKYAISGSVRIDASGRFGEGKTLVSLTVDGEQLAAENIGNFQVELPGAEGIRLGPFAKPRGVPARVTIRAEAPPDRSRLYVADLLARVGDVYVSGWGTLHRNATGDADLPMSAEGTLAIWTRTADSLAKLAPNLERLELSGGASVTLRRDRQETRDISGATLRMDELSALLGKKRVHLDGEVTLNGISLPRASQASDRPADAKDIPLRLASAKTEGLEFRVGQTHGWLIADVRDLVAAPEGQFRILCESLYDKELAEWLSPAPQSRPDAQSGLIDEQARELSRKADNVIAALRRRLSRAQLEGKLTVDRMKTFDAAVGRVYELRHLDMDASVRDGEVMVSVVTGLNGGTVHQSLSLDLTDDAPVVNRETTIQDVIAAENIRPQLARHFPGNTVSGYFHRQESVTIPLPDLVAAAMDARYPLHPKGTAETVALEGFVVGRAAPKFVTAIFPGLNLAKYNYRKMTAFAEYKEDGTAVNDMVFTGSTYDVYMEGETNADNIGRYEIGVILLSAPQSAQWNHVYRQGRIPILNWKAEIRDGSIHDEEVSYLWPTETLQVIFVKNNFFYRLWLAERGPKR